jgi:hypothetical protein
MTIQNYMKHCQFKKSLDPTLQYIYPIVSSLYSTVCVTVSSLYSVSNRVQPQLNSMSRCVQRLQDVAKCLSSTARYIAPLRFLPLSSL